jgi:excisionase family DNA binding protein
MDIIASPINDAARALGVGRSTIYKLINAGQLSTIKIGRRTLIKTDSVRALVEAA